MQTCKDFSLCVNNDFKIRSFTGSYILKKTPICTGALTASLSCCIEQFMLCCPNTVYAGKNFSQWLLSKALKIQPPILILMSSDGRRSPIFRGQIFLYVTLHGFVLEEVAIGSLYTPSVHLSTWYQSCLLC